MSHGLERRGDLGAPSFAEIRRVFNGACEIEKHERRLSAIRGCRSTQIWRGLGRVFQRFSYFLPQRTKGRKGRRGKPASLLWPYKPPFGYRGLSLRFEVSENIPQR